MHTEDLFYLRISNHGIFLVTVIFLQILGDAINKIKYERNEVIAKFTFTSFIHLFIHLFSYSSNISVHCVRC